MKYVESDTLELKRCVTKELKKEIIAFANTKGGKILIGVEDDGEIVGVNNANEVCEQISSMINDGIKPDITTMIDLKIVNIEDKDILELNVQRGCSRPYYQSDKGLKPSGVFIRLGNTSIPANETSIRNMIIETDGTKYENIRSLNQELTFNYAKEEFKKRGLSFRKVQQRSLGIIGEDDLYTNLGLLLSDQCQHIIKVAVFEGIDKEVFKTRKEFSGSVLKQLTDAYEFINLNNNVNSSYDGLLRIDSYDYDKLVIREALLNAIIHRDYSFSGSILVNIYTDRIEFISLGGLPNGLTLDDIMLGVSQCRNEKLANVFYRLELVEAYGTGIQKIKKDYKNTRLIPEFNVTQGAFQVVLPNKNVNKKL